MLTVIQGDALRLPLAANSIDAIVCDPPYGLDFMGKDWDWHATPRDFQAWCQEWAAEAIRVLKPGGHLLAFGGTRTYHRLTVAIEDAGFEIRDSITWLYGQGFPKSLDVGKALDKMAGVEREIIEHRTLNNNRFATSGDGRAQEQYRKFEGNASITAPATEDAQRWQGWGTALKPASEPIVVARKPLAGTVAQNVLAHGAGALNIDATRVRMTDTDRDAARVPMGSFDGSNNNLHRSGRRGDVFEPARGGRWPSNVLLSHTLWCEQRGETRRVGSGSPAEGPPGRRPRGMGEVGERKGDPVPNGPTYGAETVEVWDCPEGCPVRELDRQSGNLPGPGNKGGTPGNGLGYHGSTAERMMPAAHDNGGGASRFFPVFRYQAKAKTAERPSYEATDAADTWAKAGIRKRCRSCGKQEVNIPGSACECAEPDFAPDPSMQNKITHPTVKPLSLMRWLVRLVTPPGGRVLDMFAGSGTTGEAALLEGFDAICIERTSEYLPLIRQRVERCS